MICTNAVKYEENSENEATKYGVKGNGEFVKEAHKEPSHGNEDCYEEIPMTCDEKEPSPDKIFVYEKLVKDPIGYWECFKKIVRSGLFSFDPGNTKANESMDYFNEKEIKLFASLANKFDAEAKNVLPILKRRIMIMVLAKWSLPRQILTLQVSRSLSMKLI